MESVEKTGDPDIRESLARIQQCLDTEIDGLKKIISKKNEDLKNYKEQLVVAEHSVEGNRQLINKLLGDLSKLQNDIDWYKKTYEKRSFLGVIKEKIFRSVKRYR